MPGGHSGIYNWEHVADGVSKGVEPSDEAPGKLGPQENLLQHSSSHLKKVHVIN